MILGLTSAVLSTIRFWIDCERGILCHI